MRVLLVNAKPLVVESLAEYPGVDVLGVWPRKHHFGELNAFRVRSLTYSGGKKLNPRAIWQIRKIISRFQPDIVHAFYGRALAHVNLAMLGMKSRPKTVSFRGITSPLSRSNPGDWVSYQHPHVDGHACESDAVRESLIRSGISADRCWTTYNTMYCPPKHRPGRAALAQFGIPPDAFVVGTVATMRRVKGVDLLLRAATQCHPSRDIYWLLIGEVIDPEIFRWATDSRIQERVRLVGWRRDASELISGADLFVMPSRAEALCQALLEAMHQGVCPVVSDAGGMKEAVRHEIDGLVVPAEDVSSLVKAICRLNEDRTLVAKFGDSARVRIADQFTPRKMAERILPVYRQVLCGEPSRVAARIDCTDGLHARGAT